MIETGNVKKRKEDHVGYGRGKREGRQNGNLRGMREMSQ